jgi:hypothetical protein
MSSTGIFREGLGYSAAATPLWLTAGILIYRHLATNLQTLALLACLLLCVEPVSTGLKQSDKMNTFPTPRPPKLASSSRPARKIALLADKHLFFGSKLMDELRILLHLAALQEQTFPPSGKRTQKN